ncbi:hypothetical protein K503DRAFT_632528 [Rhizopogon vinicolor AM-OR11-026]|uniref:Uncharacterized protein n=1 Tax=Rhizopogon vinicolor AM-OR11-026 TaxID=1314800 RepID=A0A1B7MHT7_9AGAM|nr:hypothetical protein K503DRAFT_632528 [Rhizopogon vinicolor AM-OR11-026]
MTPRRWEAHIPPHRGTGSVAIKDVNGKTIMDVRGKQVKECIRMTDGRLASGDPQQLYFPEGPEKARWFKGMAQLLVERQTFQVSRRRNSLLLPSTNVQPTRFHVRLITT